MDIGRITSRQNRLVREAAALAADGEKRREKGLFLCEGARLCQDAARSGVGVEICFFTPQARERYRAYVEPVLACCREAYEIEDHVAALLSATKHTQGVFCLCRWPQGLAGRGLPLDGGPCLVLEQLQDPGNLGTVLRTAEALGVDRVYLLGDCCDPLSPKALRASMGAAFRVRLAAEASPQRLCGLLRERGYQLHAAVPHPGRRPQSPPCGLRRRGPRRVRGQRGRRPAGGDHRSVPQPGDHPHGGPGRVPQRLGGGHHPPVGDDPGRCPP